MKWLVNAAIVIWCLRGTAFVECLIDRAVVAGTNFTISCPLGNISNETSAVVWYKDGRIAQGWTKERTHHVINASVNDSGLYTCNETSGDEEREGINVTVGYLPVVPPPPQCFDSRNTTITCAVYSGENNGAELCWKILHRTFYYTIDEGCGQDVESIKFSFVVATRIPLLSATVTNSFGSVTRDPVDVEPIIHPDPPTITSLDLVDFNKFEAKVSIPKTWNIDSWINISGRYTQNGTVRNTPSLCVEGKSSVNVTFEVEQLSNSLVCLEMRAQFGLMGEFPDHTYEWSDFSKPVCRRTPEGERKKLPVTFWMLISFCALVAFCASVGALVRFSCMVKSTVMSDHLPEPYILPISKMNQYLAKKGPAPGPPKEVFDELKSPPIKGTDSVVYVACSLPISTSSSSVDSALPSPSQGETEQAASSNDGSSGSCYAKFQPRRFSSSSSEEGKSVEDQNGFTSSACISDSGSSNSEGVECYVLTGRGGESVASPGCSDDERLPIVYGNDSFIDSGCPTDRDSRCSTSSEGSGSENISLLRSDGNVGSEEKEDIFAEDNLKLSGSAKMPANGNHLREKEPSGLSEVGQVNPYCLNTVNTISLNSDPYVARGEAQCDVKVNIEDRNRNSKYLETIREIVDVDKDSKTTASQVLEHKTMTPESNHAEEHSYITASVADGRDPYYANYVPFVNKVHHTMAVLNNI